MFNALNRYLSRLDGDAKPQQNESHGYGFQVLRNTNLELAIEPWFDYIVGINGRMIDNPDPRLFAQEIRNCAGGTVALGLWSAKGQRTRVMHVPVPAATGSLGLAVQWASVGAAQTIWHVLDVPAHSPADAAGLLPYSDYVLGTPDGALHGEAALGELVDDFVGRPLRLWVYNHEYDVTREVQITPSREWGGAGALGCTLGFGALHRLPPPLHEPVSAPGETLFDGGGEGASPAVMMGTDTFAPAPGGGDPSTFVPAAVGAPQQQPQQGSEFLVPAQMMASPPPPAGAGQVPPRGKKKEKHGHGHGPSPNRMMDDYFAEQEKKSKELDGNIAASKTPPPPPPKAGGGPPKAPPKAEAETTGGDEGGVE
ncbi:GRASP55/65 PDZ-like domain-containing protein [Xylariomycetidae sp. FL0641]|nr:GRASP55/65 PDZ-like domain-containing protein [Xylariomycetidae sp. FL0641]